jgi:hypothetical protein
MPHDELTPDLGDQAAVDNAAKDAARIERDREESFRHWMSHDKGRALLGFIVDELCHLGETFAAVDDQGRSDTHRTYLHLGERNIGAWFDAQMRKHPKLYMQMLTEQQVDRELRLDRIREQNKKDNKQWTSIDGCFRRAYWVIRMANFDTTTAGLAGSTPPDIFAIMSKAVVRLPTAARLVSGITKSDAPTRATPNVRLMFFCDRTAREYMDIQAIRDKNVLLRPEDYAGKPIVNFRNIGIGVVDQLLDTEARVQ